MKYVSTAKEVTTPTKKLSKPAKNRDAMMLEYYSLVKIVAKKMAARLPASVEFDDLVSAGLIGLMQATERFKPEKGYKFKTYAEFRIRGAMIDELRSQDWCPKGMRQKAKQFERVCEKLHDKKGRRASDKEIAQALHLSKPKYEQLVRDVNTLEQMNLAGYIRVGGDEDRTQTTIELVPDNHAGINPFDEANKHDVRDHIEKALRTLPDTERQVLSLYYFEELNLKEIGKRLSLSESRVCQLHAKAISQLKGTFADEQLDEMPLAA
ncbi:MAG: FliA/WhiG family RNA polymerase sigma factor [Proteobacteria bacterium]|nr:MAG: FliA/WhiG family RNA polymerase sigma factor [Pseudomonadota bacterium]